MPKYGQYCPVAQALELIGDRWTLLIIRDMLTGTAHFNDMLRGLPGLSRALLSRRLQQLQDAGIIEKRETDKGRQSTEYVLTEAGFELQGVINALLVWGTKWSFADPRPEDLDPLLLMWWMRGRVNIDNLPEERITIQFDFYAPKCDSYWLVLSKQDVVICMTDPGFDINLVVCANLHTFFKIWLGQLDYNQAIQSHDVRVDGIPRFQRAFPDWFMWSAAASYVRQVRLSRSETV